MASEKTIYVAAVPQKNGGGVFWERDTDHPGGEVFVAVGDPPVEVAETGAVQEAVRYNRLVKVDAAEAKKAIKEHADATAKAQAATFGIQPVASVEVVHDPDALAKLQQQVDEAHAKLAEFEAKQEQLVAGAIAKAEADRAAAAAKQAEADAAAAKKDK